MATRGRNICNTLKAIRKQIADANGISYSPEECHFKGECKGTCPKCEQDVRDLEHELHLRQMAGKAIKVAGVALGITALTASATSCATQKGYYKSTPPKSEKVIPILFQEYTTNDTALLQAKDSLSKKGVLFVQGHLISDEDNEPLIGASVIAKHSGKYAITDVNGNFTLEVEQGDTITVQYIGFIDRSIKLSEMSRDKLNIITLIFNESALGEVVAGIVPEVRVRETAPVIKREDTFEEASFPGGSTALTQYIKTNLQYPKECREGAPIGRVILGFTVNKDGSLSNIKVEKSLVPILDEEAIRVLKSMPKWTPAKKNGKVVKSHATVPFTFKVE